MAKKQQLILIVSDLMSTNKKQNRQENRLVRMSEDVREFMDFKDNKVEVYPSDTNTSQRLKGAMLLDIYKAYSSDLKKLKEKKFSKEELKKIGFVTKNTFKKISNTNDVNANVWVSDDINDSVLGADPEFIFKDSANKIIHADSLLNYNSVLGSDGPMAEIRPTPSINPTEFIKTIKDIFVGGLKKSNIKHLQWIAGCFYTSPIRSYSIGGHVHIGTPIQLINGFTPSNLMWFFYCLNKILDELIGIPLTKLDGIINSRERRTRYGYFGELRCNSNRLEYRSLSGTWLLHPELTGAVIGTVKAIVNETYIHVMNNKIQKSYIKHSSASLTDIYSKGFNEWHNIGLTKDIGCTCSTIELKTKIDKPCAADMTIEYVKKWYKRIKNLSTYNDYATYIDTLYNILLMPLSVFNKFDRNLQHNWIEDAPFIPIKKQLDE